jgi:hypothetical protein
LAGDDAWDDDRDLAPASSITSAHEPRTSASDPAVGAPDMRDETT